MREPGESPVRFPYAHNWSPGVAGTYVIHAVAMDNSGNRVMSTPVTVTSTTGSSPPTPILHSPATGLSVMVNTPINLHATATDVGDGVVTNLNFVVNGGPPASTFSEWDSAADVRTATHGFTPTQPGRYVIHAVARDDDGNAVSTDPHIITVNSYQASREPTVALVYPANNATFTSASTIRRNPCHTSPRESA